MKTLAATVGWVMLIIVQLLAIGYFADIYGGLGFFGSIMTMPFSGMYFILKLAFTGILSFVIVVGWLFIAGVLLAQAE